MIDFKVLRRSQWSITCLVLCVMFCSLVTISSHSLQPVHEALEEAPFFTRQTRAQLKWFAIGLLVYFLSSSFDYQQLRRAAWPLYSIGLLLLFGLFFTTPIANVHRWYRLPGLGMSVQPSEFAKISFVIALACYLETSNRSVKTLLVSIGVLALPFLLILKQPDLGSALVLSPVALGMLYLAQVAPRVVRWLGFSAFFSLLFIMSIFLGFLSHEELRPWAITFFRDYQYDRLHPGGYHNIASQTAVALGSFWGKGWRQGIYANQGWLPETYTDSIFASFSEEFGLAGGLFLILLYAAICLQMLKIGVEAKDCFGKLLATGFTLYFSVHVLVNIAMMIGLFPITGVALPLMSYGGSASLFTFMALGLVQSVWARRFAF